MGVLATVMPTELCDPREGDSVTDTSWTNAQQLAVYRTVEYGGLGAPRTFKSGQSLLLSLPAGQRVKPYSAHTQSKWIRHDEVYGRVRVLCLTRSMLHLIAAKTVNPPASCHSCTLRKSRPAWHMKLSL